MAVHFASVAYINSSLLKQFVGDSVLDLNLLYILGSCLGVLFLVLAPLLLKKSGSVAVFLFFIALEIFAVFGMGSVSVASLFIFLFIIHISADSMLYLCFDLNLEQETKNEGSTGHKRGVFLTVSNMAWVLSPLALVFLISQNNFNKVYFLSSLVLVPLFLIVAFFFKNTRKTKTATSDIWPAIKLLIKGGDRSRIIVIQFILNFFYAWMVIYLPLLLNREIGFSWDKIGFLFVIMLLPFLLFELPAGIIGDKKLGEKEILVVGLIIMFLATLIIPLPTAPVFWIWATILFVTRLGASLVEISSESYFFKHIKEEDTGLISLFRVARPFSYIIAPLIAMPVIFFFSYSASFYFLAVFVLIGLFFIPKVDTK